MSANSWHWLASCSSVLIRSAARCEESAIAWRNWPKPIRVPLLRRAFFEQRIDQRQHRLLQGGDLAQGRHGRPAGPAARAALAAPSRGDSGRRRQRQPRRRQCSRSSRWSTQERSKALAHHRSSASAPAAAVISAAAAASRCKNAAAALERVGSILQIACQVARSCAARPTATSGVRPSCSVRWSPRATSSRTRSVSRSPPKMRGGSSLSRSTPANRCGAPAGGRPGCRCPPSRHTAGTAA